jgi:hypothetical protein
MTFHDEEHRRRLRWRGVEVPCLRCLGSGVRCYASTSTWQGGMGGASLTKDVCDHCWGSGDAFDHWTDLRKLRDSRETEIQNRVRSWFADQLGTELTTFQPALREVLIEVEKLTRKRKRSFWFYRAAEVFTQTVRRLLGDPDPGSLPKEEEG